MDPGSEKDKDRKKKTLEEITDSIDRVNELNSTDKLKKHGIFDISEVNSKMNTVKGSKRPSVQQSKYDSSSTLMSNSNNITESKGSTVTCSKRNSDIEMFEHDFMTKFNSKQKIENPYFKKVKESLKNVKNSDFKYIRENFINFSENNFDKSSNFIDLDSNKDKDDINILYKTAGKNESLYDNSVNSSTAELYKIFNSPSFKISDIKKESNTGSKNNENRKRSMN